MIAEPSIALDAITHRQSTFTHRHSAGIDQFNEVMGAMRGSPDLVELGKDGHGEDRLTTRDMIEAEQRLHRAAEMMALLDGAVPGMRGGAEPGGNPEGDGTQSGGCRSGDGRACRRVRGRRYLVQNAADAVRCRGEKGKAGGGLKVVKKLDASGEPIRGDREIIPEEAEVACYIFREFASAKARRPSLSI
ncbi:hypothetical protein [Paracoccus sp. pheM1]|uniref:hypothetical protein n=1 Tax=Paracoccus sp. pheM1 TaxID=2831675 RepID=UPI001F0B0265|nr:hypothetical protein [Paracoccus sp. pheM1]